MSLRRVKSVSGPGEMRMHIRIGDGPLGERGGDGSSGSKNGGNGSGLHSIVVSVFVLVVIVRLK